MTEYNAEEYSNYRIQKAKDTIQEVEQHIQNEFWNTAINRMYYTCYYAVSALLVKKVLKHRVIKGFGNYLEKSL
jgi:uncharacterized protein (UPF0332 family)